MASHPASIYHERLPLPGSSGSFTALGGGTSQRGSMGGIGLASGGGTGGIGAVGAGSSMPGVGLGLPLHHPQHHHRLEEQVAKLKKVSDVVGLLVLLQDVRMQKKERRVQGGGA